MTPDSRIQSLQPIRRAQRIWLVVAVLAIPIAVVYGRALDAPFIFDDHVAIVKNTSIRSLWPLIGTEQNRGPLNPVRDLSTSARPLVNYSFALNYHFGGLDLVGYHVVNVVIHFLSALLLWAIVRRALALPYFGGRFDSVAGWLALATALLWSLHPLHTETVQYITQRTELMMAFFYLATLYFSLRYWSALPLPPREACRELGRTGPGEGSVDVSPTRSRRTVWLTLAILSCLAGMLSKEVMVSAPLVILLFERTFIAGSFTKALRQSWPLYLGLAVTWIPLIVLSAGAPRSFSSGFHLAPNRFVWWFTQCKVLLMYLKLAIWPWPLRCQYELPYVDTFFEFCIFVVPVLLMAALAIALLWRNHPVGFLLVSIGLILAPTSIMPILTEMASERRMYLPLACLAPLLVVGTYLFAERQLALGRAAGEPASDSITPRAAAFLSVAALALLYATISARRLPDYYNETLMWQQVAESEPNNFLARYNLGIIYNHDGRVADSFAELQAAVAANPNFPNARSAFGFALLNAGRLPEAIASIQAALDLDPDHVSALNNMGIALIKLGRYPEAINYLEHALRVDPTHADAHTNLGNALMGVGRTTEAAEQFQAARSLVPDHPVILNDLATSLANTNQLPQAIELFKRAVELRPDYAAAHNGLGIALYRSGDVRGATQHFQRFRELSPNDAAAYINLSIVAAGQGDFQQAASLCEQAVKLLPNSAEARHSLAMALSQAGRSQEAIEQFQKALELKPDLFYAYMSLAQALAAANRPAEAVATAQRGIAAAQAAGDEAAVKQIGTWLEQYQSELGRSKSP